MGLPVCGTSKMGSGAGPRGVAIGFGSGIKRICVASRSGKELGITACENDNRTWRSHALEDQ